MREEQIKSMLNGIINNGEKWEYRWCTADGWSNWKEYKLGDRIFDDYEYRKVETWYVMYSPTNPSGYYCNCIWNGEDTKYFESTSKEECEKWIEEHTKKSWLEEYMKSTCSNKFERDNTKIDITEVCKKIMKELPKYLSESLYCEVVGNLRLVFKDLGIKL